MRPHEHAELDAPPEPLAIGARGRKVEQVQEWLCLHDFRVAVDGRFGPATRAAVEAFQNETLEPLDEYGPAIFLGEVNANTWHGLTNPLRRALEWKRQQWPTRTDGHAVVDVARAYLEARPREAGKPNGGPWVRHFCRGQEVAWCAGFATTVLQQALGHDEWYTLSCDELAHRAMTLGRLIMALEHGQRDEVKAGDLFLIRKPGDTWEAVADWIHTGIVTAVHSEHFETVEGNTTLDGSREGTAVHKRMRAFNERTDFIRTGRGP